MLIGILPTAGKSSRLSGVAKFALPFANPQKGFAGELTAGLPLIASHVAELLKVVDHCIVPTSIDNLPHLREYLHDPRITVQVIESSSLSETLARACAPWNRPDNKFILRFPDTVYLPEMSMDDFMSATSASDVALGLWKFSESDRGKLGQIQLDLDGRVVAHQDKNSDCSFPYVWGCLSFSTAFLSLIDTKQDSLSNALDAAISNPSFVVKGVITSGRYFDLGTFDGIATYAGAVRDQFQA